MSTCHICNTTLQTDETGTCLPCLNHTRGDLSDITTYWHQLPDAITTITGISYDHTPTTTTEDTPTIGGTALIMLAGGTANSVTSARDGSRDHAPDNHPTDPPSAAAILASIEDDWRHQLNQPPANYTLSTTKSADWLHRNIHLVARVHNIADDATTIHDLKTRMETVTGNSRAPERTYFDCFDCGTRLIRPWTDHGLEDTLNIKGEWEFVNTCPVCRRRYTEATARLAMREKILSTVKARPDATVTEPDARRMFTEVARDTIRVWIHRGKLRAVGRDVRGRAVYRVGDIQQLVGGNPAGSGVT